MDFSFLKSNRFWALVGLAVVAVLKGYDLITPEIAVSLETLFGGFVIVRSVDRFSEQI